jgi:hypothetical protein
VDEMDADLRPIVLDADNMLMALDPDNMPTGLDDTTIAEADNETKGVMEVPVRKNAKMDDAEVVEDS